MRHEVDAGIGAARELEPVEHGRIVAIGIDGPPVRPEALASHDVLDAVTVHVDEIDGVDLGKLYAVFVLARVLVEIVGLGEEVVGIFVLSPERAFEPGTVYVVIGPSFNWNVADAA